MQTYHCRAVFDPTNRGELLQARDAEDAALKYARQLHAKTPFKRTGIVVKDTQQEKTIWVDAL